MTDNGVMLGVRGLTKHFQLRKPVSKPLLRTGGRPDLRPAPGRPWAWRGERSGKSTWRGCCSSSSGHSRQVTYKGRDILR